jgi:hypothetical protein
LFLPLSLFRFKLFSQSVFVYLLFSPFMSFALNIHSGQHMDGR